MKIIVSFLQYYEDIFSITVVCISGYYKYLNFKNGGSGQRVIMKIIVPFLQYYEDIFSQEEPAILNWGCM